jgi:hypothetical protein
MHWARQEQLVKFPHKLFTQIVGSGKGGGGGWGNKAGFTIFTSTYKVITTVQSKQHKIKYVEKQGL